MTHAPARSATRALPLILSINGGYVDAAGYVALQGLFSSHVTGNFVTLGAALATGSSGTTAKLLALPTFCVVVMGARLAGHGIRTLGGSAFHGLVALQVVLLGVAAGLAIHAGPFHDADAPIALLTGELLVAAMALQNAVHRVHLPSTPPSTVMTGTTTQLMLDVTDWLAGPRPVPAALRQRIRDLLTAVLTFAIGCGVAALLFAKTGMYCFLLPPLLALLSLCLRGKEP